MTDKLLAVLKGGRGSGNFGHKGRKGMRGGSSAGSGGLGKVGSAIGKVQQRLDQASQNIQHSLANGPGKWDNVRETARTGNKVTVEGESGNKKVRVESTAGNFGSKTFVKAGPKENWKEIVGTPRTHEVGFTVDSKARPISVDDEVSIKKGTSRRFRARITGATPEGKFSFQRYDQSGRLERGAYKANVDQYKGYMTKVD